MKKVTCAAVKGPEDCTHVFEFDGGWDEFMQQAHPHFEKEHAEMIANVTEKEKMKWAAAEKVVIDAT